MGGGEKNVEMRTKEEVNILFFEFLDLSLDLLDCLILLIHLDQWFVSDIHRPGCIIESR